MKAPQFDPVKTVLTISMGFLVVYVLGNWHWALLVSLIVGVSGLLSRWMADKINRIWSMITLVLSMIVPNVLMGIIFYGILFPLSVVQKITGTKDLLQLKKKTGSSWTVVDKPFSKQSFEKPW